MSTHRNRITGPIVPAPASSSAVAVQNAGPYPLSSITPGSEAWGELFGRSGRGLPAPNEYAAAASTAIYACTNLISGAIATLPVNINRIDVKTGERDRLFDDDLNWIFNEEMSPRWNAAVGWEYLSKSLLFEGDAIAIIKRDRVGRPKGLEPRHPRLVQNGVTDDGSRMVYRVHPEVIGGRQVGEIRDYDQDDILHVPGFGFNGLRGMSPLRYSLRQAGAIALAQQDYAANFFANSARPDYALTTDQQLQPPKVKELQDLIDERHRTPENSHRPMLLHSGLKMSTLSISASDMQLLEQRKFSVEEIARAYGVPPFMIGHNEKTTSWGSGVAAMGIGFVRFTLRQHLNKFQTEINRKIFRTASRAAHFDTTDLEQADFASLMQSLRIAVGRAGEPGIMRVNEARAALKLKKDPAGEFLGINPGAASPNPDDGQQQQQQQQQDPAS